MSQDAKETVKISEITFVNICSIESLKTLLPQYEPKRLDKMLLKSSYMHGCVHKRGPRCDRAPSRPALESPIAARGPDASATGGNARTRFGRRRPARTDEAARAAGAWETLRGPRTGKGDPRKDTDGSTARPPWSFAGKM